MAFKSEREALSFPVTNLKLSKEPKEKNRLKGALTTKHATAAIDSVSKEGASMPKNGSGDNLSTLSQSPPLPPEGVHGANRFKAEPEITT